MARQLNVIEIIARFQNKFGSLALALQPPIPNDLK